MLSTLVVFEGGGFDDTEWELGGNNTKTIRKSPRRAQDPSSPLPHTSYPEKQ